MPSNHTKIGLVCLFWSGFSTLERSAIVHFSSKLIIVWLCQSPTELASRDDEKKHQVLGNMLATLLIESGIMVT